MTMEKTKTVRHRWKWCEHNITVSSYVPMDIYDQLVERAKAETAARGRYISISELIREILERSVISS